MKKEVLIVFLILGIISIISFVSAERYTINIKGEPRTPDGKIDLMYDSGSIVDDIKTPGKINNDEGYFEVVNSFESQKQVGNMMLDNSMNVYVSGTCFYHSYNIMRKEDNFEVSDAYDPEHKVIMTTRDTSIDLGVLQEDRSNQVMVDFDVPVKFLAEDLSGNLVAENSGYSKFTGMSNSFKPNTQYKLTLTTEDNQKVVREITTGNYCESTRVIKKGNYFSIENFPNNSFPPIGFFKNLWISIIGFRLVVIIPLLILILVIIIIVFLIIRRRKYT